MSRYHTLFGQRLPAAQKESVQKLLGCRVPVYLIWNRRPFNRLSIKANGVHKLTSTCPLNDYLLLTLSLIFRVVDRRKIRVHRHAVEVNEACNFQLP